MKKKLLIIFSGSRGHYNAISRFTSQLVDHIEITFASHLNIGDKNTIQLNTFPAFLNYEFKLSTNITEALNLKFSNGLLQLRKEELSQLISITHPNIIACDTLNAGDVLLLLEILRGTSCKIFLIHTTLSRSVSKINPPLTSNYSLRSWNGLNYATHLIKQGVKKIHQKIAFLGKDDLSQLKKYIKLNCFDVILDERYCYFPGFTNVIEFILCPQEIEYSTFRPNINEVYLGGLIKKSGIRKDSNYLTISNAPFVKKVLVFMGSVSKTYDREKLRFIKILAKLTVKFQDTFFVIIDRGAKDFIDQKNVRFVKELNILENLENFDCFITHGGTNSVKEAAMMGVPTLNIPPNTKYDHFGVSLRTSAAGLGYHLPMSRVTEKNLLQNIDNILKDDAMKNRVELFREKMYSKYSDEYVQQKFQKYVLDSDQCEIKNYYKKKRMIQFNLML